ncbi:MAG: A/G-specific adenine glycosylase [Bacteroidota bacterium]
MFSAPSPAIFSNILLTWFSANARDLPWRKTTDPYKIWLSEIILQQTRVAQGMPYYHAFTEAYPTVNALALAPLEEVLRLWQGLGYYSRARSLHNTAQTVIEEYNGIFPTAYADLLKLKGIGPYTAAAVASFSANERAAVVDGNVYRVLARVFGIQEDIMSGSGKRRFAELALALIPYDKPGEYNQAIMEFGALQCVPVNPLCMLCPLRETCFAYNNNMVRLLPVKTPKAKVTERYINYLAVFSHGKLLMHKRTGKDIWEGLYEFPIFESTSAGRNLSAGELIAEILPGNHNVEIMENLPAFKHLLTHRRLIISVVAVVLPNLQLVDSGILPGSGIRESDPGKSFNLTGDFNWYSKEQVSGLPKPVPVLHSLLKLNFV